MPGRLPARPEREVKPVSTLRSGATAARFPVEGQGSAPITRSAAGRAAAPLWISPGGYGL